MLHRLQFAKNFGRHGRHGRFQLLNTRKSNAMGVYISTNLKSGKEERRRIDMKCESIHRTTVRDDLRDNYGVENPSQAIFNLFIQGSKHYDQFTSNVGELMQLEQDFMSRIVGGRVNNILDLNRVYVENIGNIFIESMKTSYN